MLIDLHSHTTASDGRLTPEELVLRAQNRQLDVLAITDHDTTSGYYEALALKRDKEAKPKLISGVEISTCWRNFEIHVVGLNFRDCDVFQARLGSQRQKRDERAEGIAAKLAKAGFDGALQGAKQYASGEAISRAHFARWLLETGVVTDMQKAFDKYLGKGERAYMKPNWVTMQEAIGWIQDAGGQAVLAHPAKYKLSNKWLRMLIADFAEANGDAMEVAQSQQAPDERRFLAQLSLENNLKASKGSDFHYPSPWADLGKNLYLPDDCVPVWENWQLTTLSLDQDPGHNAETNS